MEKTSIKIIVNDSLYEREALPRRTLLDFLREDIGLKGTKEGCGEGECGACTILLNGEPVPSCIILAVDVQGKEVITIEGLERNGQLHPIQKAFMEHGAIQCGYCTPGMILTAKALLDKDPNPTRELIQEAISGNLCRCTGYKKIVEAVEAAAVEMRQIDPCQ